MPMRRCHLDGKTIGSLDDLYDQLSARLPLPDHFGRNLDALRDVLSTDVEGPFEIAWMNADASKRRMGKAYDRVLRLLRALEKERDDFRLKIDRG